jgi:hypothetical protein
VIAVLATLQQPLRTVKLVTAHEQLVLTHSKVGCYSTVADMAWRFTAQSFMAAYAAHPSIGNYAPHI